MGNVFKCISKETGYHLTQDKNYEVDLNVAVSKVSNYQKYHSIINDKGVQHYISDDDLEKFFIYEMNLEKFRRDNIEKLLFSINNFLSE
jgi:hypothetical protein